MACLLVTLMITSMANANDPGVAVGTAAPSFTLLDQNGQQRALEGLLKRGKLAVVFFRSADW